MLSAFWNNWVGLLFDTAPYIVLWLVIEVILHSRSSYYAGMPGYYRLWFGLRYVLGFLWPRSWHWQLVGITFFAALALVLSDELKQMADLVYDASYQPQWYDVLSASILGVLTLVHILKRLFPNTGGGCDGDQCSIDGRRE